MGAENMELVNLGHGTGAGKTFGFKVWLSGEESSNWFILPAGAKALTVTVYPSGGAYCFLQTTTDTISDIINNRQVVGVDWDRHIVGAPVQQTFEGPVTAVRCTQTTEAGTVKFTGVCS